MANEMKRKRLKNAAGYLVRRSDAKTVKHRQIDDDHRQRDERIGNHDAPELRPVDVHLGW